jgi:uncharacterized protein (DUF58 family)
MRRLGGMAALGVTFVVAAGLFDAEALWVPAAGLLGLSGLLAGALWLSARGARVERELGAGRVIEGEPLALDVRASMGLLPLAAGAVTAGEDGEPVAHLAVGCRRARARSELAFPRRGRRRLAAPTLRLSDPLGLGALTVRGSAEDAVLVLPRVLPVRVLDGHGPLGAGETAMRGTLGAESELDGLRPYRDGTPATRIHWPALARGMGLVERRLLPDADRLPLVALDPSGPAAAEELDAAVRAAASLAVALARAGGCAVLLPGERRPAALDDGLAAWPAVHARLALVEPGPPPLLGAQGHRHRTLLYVAARRPSRLPAALALGPRGSRILVLPGDGHPGPAVLEVAGCRGYAVSATVRAEAA